MLERAEGVGSLLECGSNIGKNIGILNHVLPSASKSIIEISPDAYGIVTSRYHIEQSFNGRLYNPILRKNILTWYLLWVC
jgi:hypothetical protein